MVVEGERGKLDERLGEKGGDGVQEPIQCLPTGQAKGNNVGHK